MRLKGIDVEYGSLKEAYYMNALHKQSKIEVKKTMALVKSNLVESRDGLENLQEKIDSYLKEALPGLDEGKENFIEKGSELLDEIGGQEIILGGE